MDGSGWWIVEKYLPRPPASAVRFYKVSYIDSLKTDPGPSACKRSSLFWGIAPPQLRHVSILEDKIVGCCMHAWISTVHSFSENRKNDGDFLDIPFDPFPSRTFLITTPQNSMNKLKEPFSIFTKRRYGLTARTYLFVGPSLEFAGVHLRNLTNLHC